MSVEQRKAAFVKEVAPFNKTKSKIRRALYNMKISETREIKENIIKIVWLLFYSIKSRKLNQVEITEDIIKGILKVYRKFFPQDDLKIKEYGLLRFLIGSRNDTINYKNIQEKKENLKDELERLWRYLNYKNSKFCKRVLDEIIHKYFKN